MIVLFQMEAIKMTITSGPVRLVARDNISFSSCPTRSVLAYADKIGQAGGKKSWRLKERGLIICALGIAAIEAVGYSARGVSMAAINTCTTITCLLLRAFSVAIWIALGWVSDQLLTKSTLRWVQFVALQVWLLLSNRSHWAAQWRLWANIQYTMTSSAQGAAASADALSQWTERKYSAGAVIACLNRSISLTLFTLSAIPHLVINPRKVHTLYGKSVEPWPPHNILQMAGEKLYKHRWTIGTWSTVAVLAALHLHTDGYDQRMELLDKGAKQLWDYSGKAIGAGTQMTGFAWTYSGGAVWRWLTNNPNWHTINDAFAKMNEHLKQNENQCSCPLSQS